MSINGYERNLVDKDVKKYATDLLDNVVGNGKLGLLVAIQLTES